MEILQLIVIGRKARGGLLSGGSANYNTSSNNTLSQGGSFVDGKTYKVTLEVKSYVRGTPIILINSGASVQVPTSVGVHTMYVVAGTSPTKVFRYLWRRIWLGWRRLNRQRICKRISRARSSAR
jgi:hypothetical protein